MGKINFVTDTGGMEWASILNVELQTIHRFSQSSRPLLLIPILDSVLNLNVLGCSFNWEKPLL